MAAPSPVAPRSGFVTAVGWTCAVIGGLTLAALVFSTFFAVALGAAAAETGSKVMPWWVVLGFVVTLLRYFGDLVGGIGLVRRLEWARRLMIALFALGVLVMLASLVVGFWMAFAENSPFWMAFAENSPPTTALHAMPSRVDLRSMIIGPLIGATIWNSLWVALYVWIIRRLREPGIRAEFA